MLPLRCHPERIPQLNGVVGRQKAVAITALLAHNKVARDLLFAFSRECRNLVNHAPPYRTAQRSRQIVPLTRHVIPSEWARSARSCARCGASEGSAFCETG